MPVEVDAGARSLGLGHGHNQGDMHADQPASPSSVGGVDADSDSVYGSQEQDELMTEMILKHRSELQKFVERTMPLVGATGDGVNGDRLLTADQDNLQNIPPGSGGDGAAGGGFDPGFRTPQPTRSRAGERLMELSRTERTDRMRLAELSDVRNEKLGRAAILAWNPHAKFARERENRTFIGDGGKRNGSTPARERSNTTPPRTTAKDFAGFSKDYVQQALDFNLVGDEDDDHVGLGDHDDDDDDEEDDDLPPPSPSSLHELLDHKSRGKQSTKAVKKYVKHMETTIAHLVQQKDELLRNQAEFDKHASGMFPTLETLNNQLSQIVQDRMLQSQANIKDDLDSELRLLRVRLNELESEAKQRRQDAELAEQRRHIESAQMKGDIASLGTTGTLQNQKMELMTSQVKKLQHDVQESSHVVQRLSQQYQIIEKRVSMVQVSIENYRPEDQDNIAPAKVQWLPMLFIFVIAVAIGIASLDTCSGLFGRCYPLT